MGYEGLFMKEFSDIAFMLMIGLLGISFLGIGILGLLYKPKKKKQ